MLREPISEDRSLSLKNFQDKKIDLHNRVNDRKKIESTFRRKKCQFRISLRLQLGRSSAHIIVNIRR